MHAGTDRVSLGTATNAPGGTITMDIAGIGMAAQKGATVVNQQRHQPSSRTRAQQRDAPTGMAAYNGTAINDTTGVINIETGAAGPSTLTAPA